MCGIAGLYNPSYSATESNALVRAMADAIVHRGPDSGDLWRCERSGLVLGHRRLAIQDLSPMGAQPMRSRSGRYTLVFNGEIYNFLSLRRKLELQGWPFRGHSDTEVLLASVDTWGLERTLKESIGMFAIGLWDSTEQVLHLTRDRIGEKPLYFGIFNRGFAFASELKALYQLQPSSTLQLDMDALSSYLRYGYISAPYTIFTNIRKLKPGHLISLPIQRMASDPSITTLEALQQPYWSLFDNANPGATTPILDDKEALDQLDALLGEIVKEQALADVPLGSFLSGGIDSSLVSAVFQANSSRPIKTFTIGFNDPSFNEAVHAKAVARHIGSDHTELYISAQDTLDCLPSMASIYDEPFADSSQIPTYLVSKMARSHVTVCLSGDGGDELFGGYNRYLWTQNAFEKVRPLPQSLRSILGRTIRAIPPRYWDIVAQSSYRIQSKKGSAAVGLKAHKFAALLDCNSLENAYRMLSSYWNSPESLILGEAHEPTLVPPRISDAEFLRDAMLWDQQWYLPGDNLVKTDRASMAVSLETRLPLLDQRLIKFSFALSNNFKIRDGKTKWLLRELLNRYVPKELIERPKMGFSVPISSWLRHELKDWTAGLLDHEFLVKQGIFNSPVIQDVLKEHLSGSHDHSHKLWSILMFQAWHSEYISKLKA